MTGILEDLFTDTAIRADIQHMAETFSQTRFNSILEAIQHMVRDKGLHSSGKPTAMYTVGTLAAKQAVT